MWNNNNPIIAREGFVIDFDEVAEKGLPYYNQTYEDPFAVKYDEVE